LEAGNSEQKYTNTEHYKAKIKKLQEFFLIEGVFCCEKVSATDETVITTAEIVTTTVVGVIVTAVGVITTLAGMTTTAVGMILTVVEVITTVVGTTPTDVVIILTAVRIILTPDFPKNPRSDLFLACFRDYFQLYIYLILLVGILIIQSNQDSQLIKFVEVLNMQHQIILFCTK
jgi:hypothetical protein